VEKWSGKEARRTSPDRRCNREEEESRRDLRPARMCNRVSSAAGAGGATAVLTKMIVPARRRLVVKSRIRFGLSEPRTASMTMRTTMKEAPLRGKERSAPPRRACPYNLHCQPALDAKLEINLLLRL
jgi:hypothetical protein